VVLERMEKISPTKQMKNEYNGVKEERNPLHKINIRKANWIGQIMRRNSLLKHVNEREGKRRRGIRCKQLLGDLKERRR
jgi:hypothetical protein